MRSQRTSRRVMPPSLKDPPGDCRIPAMPPPALTAEQRRFFAEQGYLVVPAALSREELAAVRREAGAAEARWRADLSLPGVRRPDLEQVLGIMEHGPRSSSCWSTPGSSPWSASCSARTS